MNYRLWIVPTTAVILSLFIGALGFFCFMLSLNGVSDSRGGTILLLYSVLAVITSVLAFITTRLCVKALIPQTAWLFWTAGFAILMVTTFIVGVVLFLGGIIFIKAFGIS